MPVTHAQESCTENLLSFLNVCRAFLRKFFSGTSNLQNTIVQFDWMLNLQYQCSGILH